MVDEVRTVLKDFNRDLLVEELLASIVPFESLQLAGFVRLNNYVGTPAPGPVVITRDKVANTVDEAQPGEIRFVVTSALSGLEAAALDAALSSHVSTNRTAEQDRVDQDASDWATLEAQYPNIGTLNDTQLRQYIANMARLMIRDHNRAAI